MLVLTAITPAPKPDRRRALELLAGSGLVIIALLLPGCSKEEDPEQVAFEKRFRREAVLVKTLKIYRFEQELWFKDRGVLRRVDATPDNVCDVLDEPPKR